MKNFELFVVETVVKSADKTSSSFALETWPEHDQELDAYFEPFGTNTLLMTMGLTAIFQRRGWPWAIVGLDRNYQLAGHAVSTRKDSDVIRFGSFSLLHAHLAEKVGPPPLSWVLFKSKDVAREYRNISPLYRACWDCLSGLPEETRWLSLAEPLPETWARTAAVDDDALFMRHSIAT